MALIVAGGRELEVAEPVEVVFAAADKAHGEFPYGWLTLTLPDGRPLSLHVDTLGGFFPTEKEHGATEAPESEAQDG